MAININGDGLIELGGTSTTQGRVRLAEDTDNGTNYVELTSEAALAANRTVTFPDADINFSTGLSAAQGGTGANTLTAEAVIIGNGTSAVKFVAAGTSGNVLTSNGTAWASQALASASDYIMQVFTTPGTWTKPAGLKAVKVTVIGGGGGSAGGNTGYGGAGGGTSIEYIDAPAIPGPQPYTVGTGGTAGPPSAPSAGGAGGTSSFGGPTAFLSATGGGGGTPSRVTASVGGLGSNGQLNIGGLYGGVVGGVFATAGGCPPTSLSSTVGIGGGSIFGGSILGYSPEGSAGSLNPISPAPGAPRGYGVGSVGGAGTGVAGGAGVVIVEEFY